MKTQPPAGKPSDPAKEQSLILSEGQRDGNIEVLAIDDRAGSVKVNNSGTIMTLTFEKDGAKLPSTPPPPGAPPALPAPTNMTSSPQPYTGQLPGPTDARHKGVPMRNLRLPSNAGVATPPSSAGTGTPGSPDAALPPTGAVPGTAPAQNVPADLTPEEQTIVLELQRQANQQNPNFPPLPQTAITPGTANLGPQTPVPSPRTIPQQVLPQ